MERPDDVDGFRREASRLVARLIPQVARDANVGGLSGRRNSELGADSELALENRQRLVVTKHGLIDRRWEDDFCDGHRRRCVERQPRRYQRWIARLVGLNVKAFGQLHLNRRANGAARVDAVGADDRRHVRRDAADLGVGDGGKRENHDQRDRYSHRESRP